MKSKIKNDRRFICVCMSPAIDATLTLDAWPYDGAVVKDVREVEAVGGKGINVARWLAKRGCNVACTGLLGVDNAALFERELMKYGIEDLFVRVPGATRRNEMIVTPAGSFKLNRLSFPNLNACDFEFDFEALGIMPGDIVILSGSLPKCCGNDFYAKAARNLNENFLANVVLDASGEPLRRALNINDGENSDAINRRLMLIKPNAEECADILGFVPHTPSEFAHAFELLRERSECVIISDGANGAWCDGEFFAAPQVNVFDTTAAGDTLLAEFSYRRYIVGCGVADAMRQAVAAGSAACTMPGGTPPDTKFADELIH